MCCIERSEVCVIYPDLNFQTRENYHPYGLLKSKEIAGIMSGYFYMTISADKDRSILFKLILPLVVILRSTCAQLGPCSTCVVGS